MRSLFDLTAILITLSALLVRSIINSGPLGRVAIVVTSLSPALDALVPGLEPLTGALL